MTSRRENSARAAAVSRALRTGGFRPLPSGTPRSREGVRVRASLGDVYVAADYDSPREAVAAIQVCSAILFAAGYAVEATDDGTALYVHRTAETVSLVDADLGARALHVSLAEAGIGRACEYDDLRADQKDELRGHVAAILAAIR